MKLVMVLATCLAIASAGGAVIASDLAADDAARPSLAPPASTQGCDHCNGTSNQTQEPEGNATEPAPPAPVEEVVIEAAPESCSESSSDAENGTFTKTALGGSGNDLWAFDVGCAASQVHIQLVLSGWSDFGAYIDFDNRFHVYDGNGTDVAAAHTSLSYGLDGEHVVFEYISEGPVEPGAWVFDLTECLLLGDYDLLISVS